MTHFNDAKGALQHADKVAVLTGAGISVESGIPAFRTDADGLWKTFPMHKASLRYFKENPVDFWNSLGAVGKSFIGAKPNKAHYALAELEKSKAVTIITQNIDGLHTEAGSSKVVEFHGNARQLVCLKCNTYHPMPDIEKFLTEFFTPTCRKCRSFLKPDATLFDEGIKSEAVFGATQAAAACDVMLIVGTSGMISPANTLPGAASKNGATVIEVNPSKTPYTSEVTDYFIQGKAGEILPELLGGV